MMTNPLRLALPCLLLTAALLSGCATAYGPHGFTGGYTETKIDDSTYRVVFNGNGQTSRDKVWYYWIYRCAELTTQNGYEFFIPSQTQLKAPALSQADTPTTRLADLQTGPDLPLSQLATHSVPTYIYIPGGTVKTYSGNGFVKMLHSPDGYDGLLVLRAATILEMLDPYIKSQGHAAAPAAKDIFKAAFAGSVASPTANRPVTMDDLKHLLPPP